MSGPTPRNINTLPQATDADLFDLLILRQFDIDNVWRDKKMTLSTLQQVIAADSIPWIEVTATSQVMAVWGKYVANNAVMVSLALPTVAAFGTELEVKGMGDGGWIVTQAAGQRINFGVESSTVGITGSLASGQIRDAVRLVCVVANTVWDVVSSQGNINVN